MGECQVYEGRVSIEVAEVGGILTNDFQARLCAAGMLRRYSNSAALKKNGISTAACSGASEPCTQFRSMLAAKRLRIVPSAALAGFVAPMVSRHFLIASAASRTITTAGPSVINFTRAAEIDPLESSNNGI